MYLKQKFPQTESIFSPRPDLTVFCLGEWYYLSLGIIPKHWHRPFSHPPYQTISKCRWFHDLSISQIYTLLFITTTTLATNSHLNYINFIVLWTFSLHLVLSSSDNFPYYHQKVLYKTVSPPCRKLIRSFPFLRIMTKSGWTLTITTDSLT